MAGKRKKKVKYWLGIPLAYNLKFVAVVYILITILSWSMLFMMPMNCSTLNYTSFFVEDMDSYSVQECTTMIGEKIQVIHFR